MYLTILFFLLTREKKYAGLLSFKFTMVSEYSSVDKNSWCVSIELHTNAAPLKGGGKECNHICNFVLCPVLHVLSKLISHKCILICDFTTFYFEII